VTQSERRRVILVGGGHAHLHVAAHARRFDEPGAEVVLVDPEDFWYSGMAPGVIGERYPPEASRVDLGRLATRAGFRYVRDRVVGVDPGLSTVRLERGGELPYDALSLDVGSVVTGAGIAGADHAIRAKPIRGLLWIREFLADPPGPVIVVGGGATGCEIAANLAARPGRPATEAGPAGGAPDAGGARVILVSTGGRLLDDLPAAAGRRAARRLGALGVEVRLGTRVVAVAVRTAEDGRPGTTVTLEEGGELRGSETVLATGLAAPAWIGEQGLPTGPDGGLAVDGSLRAAGLARVFGAGDCIDFGPRSLPKLGVYAVREAPVLLENLLATLAGRPLRAYRPQRRALRILNLSDGTALAVWGGLAWMGRGTMAWKEWLDRRFVAEYAGAE